MEKNSKEWKTILLWGGSIGAVYAGLTVFNFPDDPLIPYLPDSSWWIFPITLFFWGVFSGIPRGYPIEKDIFFRCVLVRRPIEILLVGFAVFVCGASWYVWSLDPYEYNTPLATFFEAHRMILSFIVGYFVIPIFVSGFLAGFIPMFLIRHALRLYRAHLKRFIEPY